MTGLLRIICALLVHSLAVIGYAVRNARLTFSSNVSATVTLTATAGNVALPSVVIPAGVIPPGATISRVTAAISWRKQVDSSAAANAVNVAQTIQVRSDAPGTFRDAIDIPDNALATGGSATDGGPLLIGDNDIAVEVVGPDTYEFQWTLADVDGNNLVLHDVQTFLIVEFR